MLLRRAWALVPALLASASAAATEPAATRCLALATYWESKGCSRADMTAVGQVVLNRSAAEEFPEEVCAVVKEGGETPPCQFSWWCDGKSDAPDEGEDWHQAQAVAEQLLADPAGDPEGALFFHSKSIEPPWTDRQQLSETDCHIFYK